MKKILFSLVLCGCFTDISAQSQSSDTLKVDMMTAAQQLYQNILPILDKVEFTGSSQASRELHERWKRVIRYLKANGDNMAQDLKDLLVSPSGKPIDLETLERFISISEQDSVKKVNINMDFLLDEMKAAGKKITDAAKKMAETK